MANVRPKLLDLYSGAGGASAGYVAAGFEVVGVDLYPQPQYPFEFHEDYALDYLDEHWSEFQAVAASPPCQGHSNTRFQHPNGDIPDQVVPTRKALEAIGLPYIIENVPSAPLISPAELCGAMPEIQKIYPLRVFRHRHFESNCKLVAPKHHPHPESAQKPGTHLEPDRWVTITGNFGGIEVARVAMGISWMSTRKLSQAIPPAFTQYLGSQLITQL